MDLKANILLFLTQFEVERAKKVSMRHHYFNVIYPVYTILEAFLEAFI